MGGKCKFISSDVSALQIQESVGEGRDWAGLQEQEEESTGRKFMLFA